MKSFYFACAAVFCLAGCVSQGVSETVKTDKISMMMQDIQKSYSVDSAAWWKKFDSRELDDVIAAALSQNNDFRASLARIEQARADLKISGGVFWPSLDVSGEGGISRDNPSAGSSKTNRSINAGLDVGYELDLFGGNRAAYNAAQSSLDASIHEAQALALITMSDTAKGFFMVLGLRDRKAIALENLRNNQDILKIVEARFNAGSASAIDLSRQKKIVYASRASLRALTEQEQKALNALSVLVGRKPDDILILTQSMLDLSRPSVSLEQPSDLLKRRPDIRAAEDRLEAADANINAARAALYPSVNLGSGFSVLKSPLGDPASTALSLAASLAVSVFDGGRLQGGVEKRQAQQAELLENYRKVILISFQEAQDAIEGVKSASDRLIALEASAAEAQKAYDLTRNLFDAGSIDLEAVIDTQNSLLNARDTLSQARMAQLNASVDLYKALGGGWIGG